MRSDSGFMERLVPCQSRLYRFIASLVPDRTDAEDLFQKSCLSAWEERGKYDEARELFPWLCGIARNHVRHHYRSRHASPVQLAADVVEQLVDLRIAEEAREEQRQRALGACLEKLPGKDRQVLEAYYGQRRPVRSVADSLGRSAEAVFKTLQRARSALHDCIASNLSGEAP